MFKLNFNCNVHIVDEPMGVGKSSSAINFINSSSDDQRFLYITPLKTELDRIIESCPDKHFIAPAAINGRKLNGLKQLIDKGTNIVSTHALFNRFDREIIELCKAQNYTLIMDEVANVVEKYPLSEYDFNLLLREFADIDPETGFLKWREGLDDYNGKFTEEKRLCELNSLAYYNGSIMIWLFPVEVFNAFDEIYILTYMFPAQMQRYYYDLYQLKYDYLYVTGDCQENFNFTKDITKRHIKTTNYTDLIHICQNKKMNDLGKDDAALSKSWYNRHKHNDSTVNQLQRNLSNFFRNQCKTKTSLNLWTVFKDYRQKLTGKGYGRGFLASNTRATNKYAKCISVAYMINKYIDPNIKNFFASHDIYLNEDAYALSEMLQWIWRSAIRNNQEINIYIPSSRMRRLLEKWIAEQDGIENTNDKILTQEE